jgi:hypothetical protein
VSEYVCPVCGKPMLSADMLCSGSFLDQEHPANVAPVLRELTDLAGDEDE